MRDAGGLPSTPPGSAEDGSFPAGGESQESEDTQQRNGPEQQHFEEHSNNEASGLNVAGGSAEGNTQGLS